MKKNWQNLEIRDYDSDINTKISTDKNSKIWVFVSVKKSKILVFGILVFDILVFAG